MAKDRAQSPEPRNRRDLIESAISGVQLPSAEIVIPPAAKREPLDNWQVVVVGNIDARQIGPGWLRLIESIDESELASANKTMTMLVTPVMSIGGQDKTGAGYPQPNFLQFDVGDFAVTVVPDRWIIQTVTEAKRGRLVNVSANVFRKLNEIYVSGYGINKNWTIQLKKLTARRLIGEQLLKTDLALPQGDVEGQIVYKCHAKDYEINIQIAASTIDEMWLQVNYNRHHQIGEQKGYYDVGKMMLDNAEDDWAGAGEYASKLLECVKRAEEK